MSFFDGAIYKWYSYFWISVDVFVEGAIYMLKVMFYYEF